MFSHSIYCLRYSYEDGGPSGDQTSCIFEMCRVRQLIFGKYLSRYEPYFAPVICGRHNQARIIFQSLKSHSMYLTCEPTLGNPSSNF